MEECWFWLDACFYLYFYLIILINNNGYPFSLLLGFRHSDTFPFPRESITCVYRPQQRRKINGALL